MSKGNEIYAQNLDKKKVFENIKYFDEDEKEELLSQINVKDDQYYCDYDINNSRVIIYYREGVHYMYTAEEPYCNIRDTSEGTFDKSLVTCRNCLKEMNN